jgi:hypothetical protein
LTGRCQVVGRTARSSFTTVTANRMRSALMDKWRRDGVRMHSEQTMRETPSR